MVGVGEIVIVMVVFMLNITVKCWELQKVGRLLYAGQYNWVHVNCALCCY